MIMPHDDKNDHLCVSDLGYRSKGCRDEQLEQYESGSGLSKCGIY